MALRHRSKRTSVGYTHDGGAFLFSPKAESAICAAAAWNSVVAFRVRYGLLCPGRFHNAKDNSADDSSDDDLKKSHRLPIAEVKCRNCADD